MTRKPRLLATVLSILFDRVTLPKPRTSWTAGNRL